MPRQPAGWASYGIPVVVMWGVVVSGEYWQAPWPSQTARQQSASARVNLVVCGIVVFCISMSSDTLLYCAAALLLKKKRRKPKRVWTTIPRERREAGVNFSLMCQSFPTNKDTIRVEDHLHIPRRLYHTLLARVTAIIQNEPPKLRKPIEPGARLKATLRYLATGDSYKALETKTSMSRHSIAHIIPDTCVALCKALQEDYMKVFLLYLYKPEYFLATWCHI